MIGRAPQCEVLWRTMLENNHMLCSQDAKILFLKVRAKSRQSLQSSHHFTVRLYNNNSFVTKLWIILSIDKVQLLTEIENKELVFNTNAYASKNFFVIQSYKHIITNYSVRLL